MRTKLEYNGSFNLILGNMWSGKTSELIRRYNRHAIGGRNCLMIKYKGDIRYDSEMVVTHDGIKIQAKVCRYLYEVDKYVKEYDVICIDEVQFYKDAHIFVDKWANMGKIVEACGLNGTFNRTEFPIISKLLAITENITFVKAVCKETGNDAVYSNINMVVDKNTTEIIGGCEKYTAVDRKTYFKNKEFYTFDMIKEYIKIYADSIEFKLDYEQIDNILSEFIDSHTDLDLCDIGKQFILIINN